MKKKKYKKIDLFVAGFINVVSLIALIFATYSWFTVNKNGKGTGTGFVFADDMEISYEIYKCHNETHEVQIVGDDSQRFSLTDLKLNQYDAVFTEKNAWSPIIIRFEISGSSVASSGNIGVRISRQQAVVDNYGVYNYSTEKLAAVTSNVCTFSAAIGIHPADETAHNIYYDAKDEFEDGDDNGVLKNFVSGSNGSYTKTDALNFDLSYTASDWIDGKIHVYFYVSYNETYTTEYVDSRDESIVDIVTDGLNVSIINDLANIEINH